MYEQGLITNVINRKSGSELAAAASDTDTVIYVEESYDFSSDGGQLVIGYDPDSTTPPVPLAYTSVDYEANAITLAAPLDLTAALDEGEDVLVYPFGRTKIAFIDLDDGDEGPQALTGRFSTFLDTGIRDLNEQESVMISDETGRWEIVAMDEEVPIVKRDALDSDEIPQPGATDGLPPAVSPTPTMTGGVGGAFITWEKIDNPEPVTYKVYFSNISPVPIDTTTLLAEVFEGSIAVAMNLPDGGAALVPGGTYYSAIVASDDDGDAAPSAEASCVILETYPATEHDEWVAGQADLQAQLDTLDGKFPITTVDISNDAISAPKILAGAVLTEKMTANSINGDRIAANTLNADKILVGTIYTELMGANTINGDRISAGTLSALKIIAGSMTTAQFTANTIDGAIITANTLNASKIIAGTITALQIAAGAITATKLSADAIDGKVITGATVQTSVSGPRVVLSTSGIQVLGNGRDSSDTYIWKNGTVWVGDRLIVWGYATLTQGVELGANLDTGGWAITTGGFGAQQFNNGATFQGGLETTAANGDIIFATLADGNAGNSATGAKYCRVNTNGRLFSSTTSPSSRKIKHDFNDLEGYLASVGKTWRDILDIPTFVWRYNDQPDVLRAGFAAEDTEEAGMDLWVGYEDNDDPDLPTGFDHDGFEAALLLVCRKQQEEIDELKRLVKN